jgi:hypothetical protein
VALETLKDVSSIDGFGVMRVEWNQPPDNFIEINDKDNAITFKIQNGPIKEVGVNGCQVDTLIQTALLMIQGLNDKFPCEENQRAIANLGVALTWLNKRTADREKRGVEGYNKP